MSQHCTKKPIATGSFLQTCLQLVHHRVLLVTCLSQYLIGIQVFWLEIGLAIDSFLVYRVLWNPDIFGEIEIERDKQFYL